MIHFTHTGQYAGTVYCGVNRTPDHEFVHARSSVITKKRAEICVDCLAVYESCGICENDSCEGCPINDRLAKNPSCI